MHCFRYAKTNQYIVYSQKISIVYRYAPAQSDLAPSPVGWQSDWVEYEL
jgi:hypothetical protein